MGTDEQQPTHASQYLRSMVAAAKDESLYILGVEIGGEHVDLVCALIGVQDDHKYMVPLARLLDAAEVEAIRQAFGPDMLDDSNAGHA